MEKKEMIFKNWGEITLLGFASMLSLKIDEVLEIAMELKLSKCETPNIRRKWTAEEEKFLIKYSNQLSVKEASNLLYRSHYATYQRIRLLGLSEMINKK